MALPRDIRRLAFQLLFQLDARGEADAAVLRDQLDPDEDFTPKEREKAFELAVDAFKVRDQADKVMLELAPTWPAHRQPAVDRAILRLAHHELTQQKLDAAVVINEAVELAKHFGTEKSPGFVNALLDKIAKRTVRPVDESAQAPLSEPPAAEPPAPSA